MLHLKRKAGCKKRFCDLMISSDIKMLVTVTFLPVPEPSELILN